MTSQPGSKAITILILPKISRSKSNQTKEFGQGIEYNEIKKFISKIMQKMM